MMCYNDGGTGVKKFMRYIVTRQTFIRDINRAGHYTGQPLYRLSCHAATAKYWVSISVSFAAPAVNPIFRVVGIGFLRDVTLPPLGD